MGERIHRRRQRSRYEWVLCLQDVLDTRCGACAAERVHISRSPENDHQSEIIKEACSWYEIGK